MEDLIYAQKLIDMERNLNRAIENGYIDDNEFQEYEALILFENGEK